MCGTYYVSMEAGKVLRTYKGYNNVPCILYSVGVFLFVKENAYRLDTVLFRKKINKFKDYTFAIYLLHWFVMHSLIRAFHIDTHSIVYRLGGIFMVSFICVCITWFIRKIPWLGRRILPWWEVWIAKPKTVAEMNCLYDIWLKECYLKYPLAP